MDCDLLHILADTIVHAHVMHAVSCHVATNHTAGKKRGKKKKQHVQSVRGHEVRRS